MEYCARNSNKQFKLYSRYDVVKVWKKLNPYDENFIDNFSIFLYENYYYINSDLYVSKEEDLEIQELKDLREYFKQV